MALVQASLQVHAPPTTETMPSRVAAAPRRAGGVLVAKSSGSNGQWVVLVLVTGILIAASLQLRWSLATSLPWQIDEVPLMVHMTGICGKVASEAEATAFVPSIYSFRHGALRSLRVPRMRMSMHVTSGFWANLTMHLFGVTPAGARVMPFLFAALAIVAAMRLAWLLEGGTPGVCLAGVIVALSPVGILYGAQIRAYSESIAASGLLLLGLEYLRRRPGAATRACLVLLFGFQLSMAVYTNWVYWVLPVLATAVLLLPQACEHELERSRLRSQLVLIGAGLVTAMAVFTVDRWDSLTMQRTVMGLPAGTPGELAAFFWQTAAALFSWPVVVVGLAGLGCWALHHRGNSWFAVCIVASLAAAAGFGVLNGRAGYERNLAFLVVPVAVAAGIGGSAGLERIRAGFKTVPVGALIAIGLGGGAAWGWEGMSKRARGLVYPDWGAAVIRLSSEPLTAGPRWICPSLTYHWVIDWYEPADADRLLQVPPGGSIEVVHGARLLEDGREIIYVEDLKLHAIVERELPGYLDEMEPTSVNTGLALRRFQGIRASGEDAGRVSDEAIVLGVAPMVSGVGSTGWRMFFEEDHFGAGLVTFRPVGSSSGAVWSFLCPASALDRILHSADAHRLIDRAQARIFRLRPLAARS